MFKQALIIGSAPNADLGFTSEVNLNDSLIICADGGLLTARKAGIIPNLFIGDCDSFAGELADGIERIILPVKKDYSDLHYAIMTALDRDVKEIVLTGCTNGRADHYLANIFLLEYIQECGAHGVILDSQNRIELYIGTEFKLKDVKYKYISVVPIDPECEGVTLHGMKYPLVDAHLDRMNPIGISNEPKDSEVSIKIMKGKALIILSRDL